MCITVHPYADYNKALVIFARSVQILQINRDDIPFRKSMPKVRIGLTKEQEAKNMKRTDLLKTIIAAVTAASMLMGITGCTAEGTDAAAEAVSSESVAAATAEVEEEPEQTLCEVEEFGYCIESYPQFYVGSDSWEDGVWSDDMGAKPDHPKGISPSLYWDPVEGASCYVIYMLDSSHAAGIPPVNFIHWVIGNYEGTEIIAGEPPAFFLALGPEPGRTHTYDIYVIALANPVERAKGTTGGPPTNFNNFLLALDTDVDGNTGNILAFGFLRGKYKAD
jgi:phosphatidylethanolamine-binding protein (PEBP) family uncharacterized protein